MGEPVDTTLVPQTCEAWREQLHRPANGEGLYDAARPQVREHFSIVFGWAGEARTSDRHIMSLLIIGNRCDLNCTTMHSGESFSQLDRVFSTAAGRHPDYVPSVCAIAGRNIRFR